MELVERQENINWFGGLEHLSILHISDIHLWFSTRILQKLEAVIAKNNPDLIVLTGDYYDLPRGAYNFRKFLIEVAQKHTIVFILGNHDKLYGPKISGLLFNIPNCVPADDLVYQFQSANGFCYNITSWKNRHHLPCNKDEKNIVLIHNPEKIQVQTISNMHLILAGHLHGSQVVLFKTKNNLSFPGCLVYKHCIDRKELGNTTLIVSKGLGDTFPFRLNCPKEVVQIIIK